MADELHSLYVSDENAALATDLYQLTMLAAYWAAGKTEEATFELFVRGLPEPRAFLIAAGLEQALGFLEGLRFTPESIAYLRSQPVFAQIDPAFFDWLAAFRFTGSVDAVLEGTVLFGNEPLLRITAPLPEAQLIETFLLSTINPQTAIASKAARMRIAAKKKRLIDFGTRRANGPQAALSAARASWIAGFDGTSNTLAAKLLGIPSAGTAAHSYVMSFDREEDAFQHYLKLFPASATLLIDTYNPLEGCKKAGALGPGLRGVRLDSGDLQLLSVACRKILDQAGHRDAQIVASGDLDELKIESLLQQGAPIDVFGVGTELVSARDAPALGGVYKLVERGTAQGTKIPTMKTSLNKLTYPGPKQVWRSYQADGSMAADVIELLSAGPPPEAPNAEPLLVRVMTGGRADRSLLSLSDARARAARGIERLPSALRSLHGFHDYAVTLGPALETLTAVLSEKRFADT